MSSEDGIGALLLLTCLLAAAAVVLVVGATAGSVLLAAGRAQDAADAAALAAAHATATGAAHPAATRAAATAGGRLVACDCTGPVVEVAVAVEVHAPAARALGVTQQRATARAALVGATVGGRVGTSGRTLLARMGPPRHLPGVVVVGSHTARPRMEALHG